MILTCNSCGKKFVVPDSAITVSGRMVQCGSCGNKWKQFPTGIVKKTRSIARPKKVVSSPPPVQQKIQKTKNAPKYKQVTYLYAYMQKVIYVYAKIPKSDILLRKNAKSHISLRKNIKKSHIFMQKCKK